MFCPTCAAANSDQARFCRACGANLETVGLALAGQLVPPGEAGKKKDKSPTTRQSWLQKWSKGVREVVQGAILLSVYLLVGFVLLAVVPDWHLQYVLMWMVLFGWMAIWGAITLARGIGTMIESKSILRQMERMIGEPAIASTTPLGSDGSQLRVAPSLLPAPEPVHPPSITEHTTERLDECSASRPGVALPQKQSQ
jgi:hypothetical protein